MIKSFNESFQGNFDLPYIADNSAQIESAQFDSVEAIFRDQEERLVQIIDHYKTGFIFGCIAWLTSIPVLKALAKCHNVQFLVQKEDFLRPDTNDKIDSDRWKEQLRTLYSNVSCSVERHSMMRPISELSVCSDPTVDGVRCVGNYHHERKPASARMHNKFIVFCRSQPGGDESPYQPEAIWTGSFNVTKNATMSYENVLFLVDKSGQNEVIKAYLQEHHLLFTISEPLDWTTEWWQGEYRFGT